MPSRVLDHHLKMASSIFCVPFALRYMFIVIIITVCLHIRPTLSCSCALPPTFARSFCRAQFAALVQITSGPVRLLSTQNQPTNLTANSTFDSTNTGSSSSSITSHSEPLVYQLTAAASHTRSSVPQTAPASPARVIALSHFSQLPTNDRLSPAQLHQLSQSSRLLRSQSQTAMQSDDDDGPADKMPADEAITFDQRFRSLVGASIKSPLESSRSNRNPEFAALQHDPTEKEDDDSDQGEQLISTFYRAKVLHAFHLNDSLRHRLARNKQNIRLWTQLHQPSGPMTSCYLELSKDQQYVIWASLDDSQQHVLLSFCSVIRLDWLKQTRRDQLQHMITNGVRCR